MNCQLYSNLERNKYLSVKKNGNNYIIDAENNIAKIELKRKNKESIWTIIDLDDLERVLAFPYTWHSYHKKRLQNNYYVMATEHLGFDEHHVWRSRTVYLNVFIGNPNNIPNKNVDHINNNPLDNRKCNLRITDVCDNTKNRKSRNTNNKSGYRNVCWLKQQKRYVVQLMINGKNTRLAYFKDVDEAGTYAKAMRQKYYGEFSGKN